MKKNNELPKDRLNRIRLENEEKKKQLTEKHGAFFGSMSNENNLPPEIESQFLDNIMAFENAFQSATQIQLYDSLERPAFRKVEELTDAEVPIELERIMKLMSNNQVCLDTICEVDDRELYRFITEELFLEEIDEMHIPGMTTHYTYEEFHPNHEYDIRHHSIDFVRSYLDKESDYYTTFMSGEAEKADWHLHFRQAFSSFKLNNFSITNLEFDTEKAEVQFDCDFVGKVEGSSESLHFLGAGEMSLLYQWDFWCVDKINFPKSTVF
ncbi:MAG: hypothetical protein PHS59_04390 [Paludibacter sp.]|nr:hypothetical protein [Paludibacter sp.]